MFKRDKSINNTSNNVIPSRFIDSLNGVNDYASSYLLYLLDNETTRKTYLITQYEHRIDLISIDIYGDEKYSWILLYINRLGVEDLIKNKVITYIPLDTLNSILAKI